MSSYKKSISVKRIAGLVVTLLICVTGPSAIASAEEPAEISGVITSQEVADRLEFIATELSDAEFEAQLWWGSWLAINSAMAIGSGVMAATAPDEGSMVDQLVAGATSLIGILDIAALTPYQTQWAAGRLKKIIENSGGDNAAALLEAEKLLYACENDEREGQLWYNHLMTFALSMAAGGVIYVGWRRPVPAVMQAMGVLAIGETKIISQPNFASRAVLRYEARFGKVNHETATAFPTRPQPALSLVAGRQSIGLGLRF